MHLDTTMLQTNTAINLVGYIKRLMRNVTRMKNGQNMTETTYLEIKREYEEITEMHNKALKRRSTHYVYGYTNKSKGEEYGKSN